MSAHVLMSLPSTDFDPTEVAITYQILTQNRIQVSFATPDGKPAKADPRMLYGTGLGLFRKILMARKDAVEACLSMYNHESFKNPKPYNQLQATNYDGLILAGGHAPGMKVYLESNVLHKITAEFFASNKPVGAICHGTIVAARSKSSDGKSVLYGYRTTCLLEKQEIAAFNLTRLWLGNYYRTYPEVTVQKEVTAALAKSDDFITGPLPGIKRDSKENLKVGFSLTDRNYISARWPGDVYNFSLGYMKLLQQ